MPSWGSYNYAFSNPVKYNDPTGMAPEIAESPDDWVEKSDGTVYWDNKTTNNGFLVCSFLSHKKNNHSIVLVFFLLVYC